LISSTFETQTIMNVIFEHAEQRLGRVTSVWLKPQSYTMVYFYGFYMYKWKHVWNSLIRIKWFSLWAWMKYVLRIVVCIHILIYKYKYINIFFYHHPYDVSVKLWIQYLTAGYANLIYLLLIVSETVIIYYFCNAHF